MDRTFETIGIAIIVPPTGIGALRADPIKSGKDYTEHSALDKFLETPEYGIDRAIVFSNERKVFQKQGITYMPVYYCMFLQYNPGNSTSIILPELEAI